jgi:sulfinoalanine decarboxylase/sulfinoalanine decarboxylase/aspartate 1-decarboxylase
VRNHPDYTLYSFDNSISVCFNYKGLDAGDLCYQLHLNNQLLVSHGTFEEQTFVRLVTINSQNTTGDIKHFFEVLENFVSENEQLFLSKEHH